MEIDTSPLILLGGIFHLGMAVFHLGFWRLFDWPRSLQGSGGLNTAITQTMNLCLVVIFAGVGLLSLLYTEAMLSSPLGRSLCLIITVFWTARAAAQLYWFGLRRQTSLVLSVIFIGAAVAYGFALLPGAGAV